MILYPAIDLKDGECVRLYKGEMTEATVFNADPAAQARQFAEQGFEALHVVDLNGAFEGRPVNTEAVHAILEATDLPVQLGGGIRDLETIDTWLKLGIDRVILGTIALRDPRLVATACRHYPERIVIGLDARAGKVAVSGWAEQSEMEAAALAEKFDDAGAAAIIYTDIDRDGTMEGLNIEATAQLANAVALPVIASGGVAGLEDLKALKAAAGRGRGNIAGVIAGRALYDGRLDPAAALHCLAGREEC